METQLKQLDTIRRQAAKIREYIIRLQSVKNLTPVQKEAVESLWIEFNTICCIRIRDKRKEYGDSDPDVVDSDLDRYVNKLDVSVNAITIVNDIGHEIKTLIRYLKDVCEFNTDPLYAAVIDWAGFEFGEVKNSFRG